jgi:hypothetical protein
MRGTRRSAKGWDPSETLTWPAATCLRQTERGRQALSSIEVERVEERRAERGFNRRGAKGVEQRRNKGWHRWVCSWAPKIGF